MICQLSSHIVHIFLFFPSFCLPFMMNICINTIATGDACFKCFKCFFCFTADVDDVKKAFKIANPVFDFRSLLYDSAVKSIIILHEHPRIYIDLRLKQSMEYKLIEAWYNVHTKWAAIKLAIAYLQSTKFNINVINPLPVCF